MAGKDWSDRSVNRFDRPNSPARFLISLTIFVHYPSHSLSLCNPYTVVVWPLKVAGCTVRLPPSCVTDLVTPFEEDSHHRPPNSTTNRPRGFSHRPGAFLELIVG